MCFTEYYLYSICHHACRVFVLGPNCRSRCPNAIDFQRHGKKGKCPLCTERIEPALEEIGLRQPWKDRLIKDLRTDLLPRWNMCGFSFPEGYEEFVEIAREKIEEKLGGLPEGERRSLRAAIERPKVLDPFFWNMKQGC